MQDISSIGFSEKDFGAILTQYSYNLHSGDIIAGTVFHQESKGFLVDVGVDIAGYLPLNEVLLGSDYSNYDLMHVVNTTREFFVFAYNKERQQLLLSIKRLEYIRAWKRIKQLEAEEIILYVPLININQGGILTVLEGLQSFIPRSHLILFNTYESMLKCYLPCKILLVDEKTNKIILSHKLALLYLYSNLLRVGRLVYGQIIQIKQYGIFINIYGIPALLHISEIGYKYINNINRVFRIGHKIKVRIIHIDMKQARLSVSRREVV
uniref:Ribosomal protein S1 n=1 Tax=Agarophyton chilense TaxID=2510777 RepID=A0A141SEV3_AGACH|nr:ribosomal protein S1 [Agarophyton chilense]AMK96821.1 ribosomal protein S1 [Agarophyton chilense]ASP44716.1 30S ribosomal protein S1 [Agarophyton chilense]UAD84453.1 ribosomal protein S1 [Agarophyton chilense]